MYAGTLGTQAIVMELDAADTNVPAGDVSGRYFYRRHHRDLLLQGTASDRGHLQLLEGKDPDAASSPRLELTRRAEGGWQGTWRVADGKALPVSLRPATAPTVASDAAPYLRQLAHDDPYESIRLSELRLQRGPRKRFMGYTLQWWREPESKISLFQIVDGYPAGQRKRINAVLIDRLWSEVSAFHDCMADARSDEGDYAQTVTPRLLSPVAVSISVFTDYDCGGAHPDFGDAPINLDARDASTLTLEDVLWVGKGKPLHYTANLEADPAQPPQAATADVGFDAYSAYRGTFFAPWLSRRLAALYPQQASADGDDECGYTDPTVWEFAGWYMTSKGIFLIPSFPRVARVCEANDDWSLLPYREVRKHPGRLSLPLP